MEQIKEQGSAADVTAELPAFLQHHSSATLVSASQSWVNWFAQLHEPPRTGRLAHFVQSGTFEAVVMAVVLCNCVFTAYASNIQLGAFTMLVPADKDKVIVGEVCFCAIFMLELMLKLVVHRWYFFANKAMRWNIFDLCLVGTSMVALIIDWAADSGKTVGISFLRSFRIVKVTRVLRVVRLLQVFRELRLMLDSLISSVRSLIWCMLLLFFLFACVAMTFVELIIVHLQNRGVDCSEGACGHDELLASFGSVQQAMLTLYMSTTSGISWEAPFNVLNETGPVLSFLFLFSITFFHFCAFNLLIGMFVEQARSASTLDKEQLIFEQRKKEAKHIETLIAICEDIDINDDGMINWHEFRHLLHDERMFMFLAAAGLEIPDARMFFDMLCKISGDNQVPVDVFVEGCMRMRGEASSIDMQTVRYELKILHQKHFEFQGQLMADLEQIHRELRSLGATSPRGSGASPRAPAEYCGGATLAATI